MDRIEILYIYFVMLFKKLLQGSNDGQQNDLLLMEHELRQSIEKAKSMAASCKINTEEEGQFETNAAGVNLAISQDLIYPDFKTDVNYNQEFWKTYLKNQLSFSIIKDMSDKTSQLQTEVEKLQGLQDQYFKLYKMKNRKKNRRLAVEIQKNYTCPYQRCYKIYGSDVSLNLHIKLKHNGGNKTDRQKLAQQICRAELRGQLMPQMRLNLPPGYLQEFRSTFVDRQQEPKQKSQG